MDLALHRKRLEVMIGRVLQGGVVLAALLGAAGGVVFLTRHGHEQPDYRAFRGWESTLRSPEAVVQGVAAGRPEAIIMLGLLVLIATPIVRVALSLGLFLAERDWTYIAITLIVLGILAWSLFGSGAVVHPGH
jgi:uncharacterized membrane protein